MVPTICSAESEPEKPRPFNMKQRTVRRIRSNVLQRLRPESQYSDNIMRCTPSDERNKLNDKLKLDVDHLMHLEQWEHFLATKINSGKTKGLFDIALRTMKLIHRNKILQERLTQLQRETQVFVASVMANPENKHFSGED